jgi:hypothetical protein
MKRPLSPSTAQEAAERATKMAKVADDSAKQDFRTRSRVEYEEKRDEGRFSSARKTCCALDEKAGVKVSYSCHYSDSVPWDTGHLIVMVYCSLMS